MLCRCWCSSIATGASPDLCEPTVQLLLPCQQLRYSTLPREPPEWQGLPRWKMIHLTTRLLAHCSKAPQLPALLHSPAACPCSGPVPKRHRLASEGHGVSMLAALDAVLAAFELRVQPLRCGVLGHLPARGPAVTCPISGCGALVHSRGHRQGRCAAPEHGDRAAGDGPLRLRPGHVQAPQAQVGSLPGLGGWCGHALLAMLGVGWLHAQAALPICLVKTGGVRVGMCCSAPVDEVAPSSKSRFEAAHKHHADVVLRGRDFKAQGGAP